MILYIWISLCTKFHFKQTSLNFGSKFAQKWYLWKTEKWTSLLNYPDSNYSKYQVSAKTDNFDFVDQIYPKRVFPVLNSKCEHHYCILRIRINLGTKFQLKLTNLIFWTKFVQKGYFWCKTEKLHFCVRSWSLLTTLNFSAWESTYITVF